MQAVENSKGEKSWFWLGLEEAGAFAKRLLGNFFRVLFVAQLFNLILASVVFYGASTGPAWRAFLAAGVMLVGAGLLGFWISTQVGIVMSLAQTIRAKGLAKRVLDALFDELLGVSEQKPEGNAEAIRGLHGMPIDEARRRLTEAGEKVLAHPVALAVPGFLRWLVRKAQAVLVWATIWVTMRFATARADADKKIDLLELRTNLTAVVDDLVTEKITQGAIRFGLVLGFGATLAGWALVAGLARLN